jgi:hypothetical protein
MSGEHPELDQLQTAYRDAVEAWISAIRDEERLASVNHDVADVDAWRRRISKRTTGAAKRRMRRRSTKTPCGKSFSGSSVRTGMRLFSIQLRAVIASAAKQSSFASQRKNGLLRRSAPRNDGKIRIRVPAARIAPGLCMNVALERTEGAGNAGRSARPQPRVQW